MLIATFLIIPVFQRSGFRSVEQLCMLRPTTGFAQAANPRKAPERIVARQ
jgi:hypothetical protein